MKKIKNRIFNLIRDDDVNNLASKIFDGIIIGLIIINVIIIIDTFNIPNWLETVFCWIELITIIVFTIEYLLRLWVSDLYYQKYGIIKSRIKYIFSFMAIIDLLAILPFYMPLLLPIDLRVLRVLRSVRLVRLFKVNRYTNSIKTIGEVLKSKASQLISSVFIILILMIISSVIMYNAENTAQPDIFENAFSGMWWSIVTLTTVGYGDIYPITVIGKIFSAIISILGIGFVAIPTGIISSGFIEKTSIMQKKSSESEKVKDNDIQFCPYCGKRIDIH